MPNQFRASHACCACPSGYKTCSITLTCKRGTHSRKCGMRQGTQRLGLGGCSHSRRPVSIGSRTGIGDPKHPILPHVREEGWSKYLQRVWTGGGWRPSSTVWRAGSADGSPTGCAMHATDRCATASAPSTLTNGDTVSLAHRIAPAAACARPLHHRKRWTGRLPHSES